MEGKCNVSIIIPTRNEEGYISKVLENLIQQDYPSEKVEILVIDGRSTDETQQIVKEFQKKYTLIRLLDNPNRSVPFALNIGIKNARGDIIIRIDAHAIYPKDYVSSLIEWLFKLNADNVGGKWEIIAPDNTDKSWAISKILAHPLAIGNAYYRIGISKVREVDTVPFGCYKKELFDKIGLFDEQLIRNQDDEFNARLKRNGGKIYLIPSIKIKYFSRNSFTKLLKMYYQYGYFKPLVNKKIKRLTTLRQLVPPLFILVLIVTFLFGLKIKLFLFFSTTILAIYLLSIGLSALLIGKRKKFSTFIYLIWTFIIIHFSYGLGYLKGIFDFLLLNKEKEIHHKNISLSR